MEKLSEYQTFPNVGTVSLVNLFLKSNEVPLYYIYFCITSENFAKTVLSVLFKLILFFLQYWGHLWGLGQLKEQEGEVITEPFFCSFQSIFFCNWFLFPHHLLFNIRTCFLSSCMCGIFEFWWGDLYFCHVSKYLHCCRLSRQWIPFKEKPLSFLACGIVDSLCFSFREHFNLPRVQFREQFFAAGSGVCSVSSFISSPLPQPCCGSAATKHLLSAPGQVQMPRAVLQRPNLVHLLVTREHLYCCKSQSDMYSKPNIASVLVCGAASGYFPPLTTGKIFK